MANDIQLKRSSVAGRVPSAANVLVGEPVINLNDKIIFTKDVGGNVIVIGAGTTSNVIEGSNLYFSNARVSTAISTQTLGNATFSSDVNVRGELFVTGASGDEGGQITLAPAVTNTSLSGQIAIDINQNRLRIFEKLGTNRGVYIDLSTAAAGAGTSLLGGSGTITSVAGVTSGAVSNAQLATATVTSQTLTNATFSANVTADRFIANNNGNSENYRVGDDIWIGDYNNANSMKLKGAQDGTQAYISFGTSDAATLGRSGTGALTYSAGFAAANVVSTGNISAGNAAITNALTAGTLQTTGNVNSQNQLVTGSLTAGTLQTAGNINANNLRVVTNSSVGTVVSGTWNGSSISTTYTDAKVTSVNGQVGAATGFATTANTLAQFASTTSAQLATLISDETGSGALVFGTGPTITLPVINNSKPGFSTTATAAGTTTLTVNSNYHQFFTGVSTQTIVLPVTSTLVTGMGFQIENNSTGNLTVNSSGGNLVVTVLPGTSVHCLCIGTALTTAADWDAEFTGFVTLTGTGSAVLATTPTLVTPVLGLATGTSVMLSANIGAAAGNVSGNFTAGNFQTAGNVNAASQLVTGSLTAGTLQTAGNVNTNNLRVVTNSSLGTVVQGTWNGSSISTTYTDAKVTSVNGQTGAATGFATTANSLSQFASTTSLQLATLISDETGSGALVFATSPTFTGNILADSLTLSGNLIVSGTTTTINSTTLTVDDKNIELGSTASPSDASADGGGITLKGTTDKTFNYVNATTAWTSSEDLNLLTGKVYEINGTSVLSSTTLGSGVVNSSLTSVGTLGSLAVTNNVSAGAFLTTGSSTAGTFQTAGNVNANNLRVVTNSSLGTVVSGTWNGASISTTYTDAKVVSVNGSTGVVTGLATTAGTLAQFGATTSAQLAGVISDETGSGALVFATTPTLVTPVLGLATGTSVMLSANVGAAAGNVSGNFTAGNFQTAGNVNSAAILTTGNSTAGNYQSAGNINVAGGLVTGSLTAGTLQTTGNINASNLRVVTNSSLGTVVSGTWNGASISTTYTDAKVISVNGQTGAATGFATTANSLSQFASTTSAQLATLISDETGSGSLVFATTPTLVTPVLGLATGTSVMLSANIGAAAGNVSGNFTAGNFQTAGNVNSAAILTTGNSTAANYQSAGNVNSASGLFTGSLTAGTLQTTGNVNASSLRVTTASSLGTVQSGTWNGSSISTTYTDAKVTSVNGQVGAATGFATTANTLTQFASTTSAQLATLISDETGSGALVFATTPTLVTPVLGLATGTSVMLSANIGAAAGNISGNFSVTGNVVASNVTVSSRVNFGNATSTVKVYQFYNGVAASFDTVFV